MEVLVRTLRHGSLAAVIAAGLLSAGCIANAAPDGPVCPAPAESTPSALPAGGQPATIVLIGDSSSSYPAHFLRSGLDIFIDRLVGSLVHGAGPITLSGLWVSANSYSEPAALAPVQLAAAPIAPTREAAASKPCAETSDNPNSRARLEAAHATEVAAWGELEKGKDDALAAAQLAHASDIASAREQWATQLAPLTRYLTSDGGAGAPFPAVRGSDYFGALCRAALAFANAGGQRLLVVIGDLEQFGAPDCPEGALTLEGIDVVALNHWMPRATEALAVREHWSALFAELGAASFRLFTPDELVPANLFPTR